MKNEPSDGKRCNLNCIFGTEHLKSEQEMQSYKQYMI